MRHREPDDAGEWWSTDGCVDMGHRRLAIIDLSPAGHQSMQCAVGKLKIRVCTVVMDEMRSPVLECVRVGGRSTPGSRSPGGRRTPTLLRDRGRFPWQGSGVSRKSFVPPFPHPFDGLRDDPTQRTEGPLEPVLVFPGEAVEIMVKDSIEGGPLGTPRAVEFRLIESR